MPSTIEVAEAMQNVRYAPGTNAPGIKPTIKVCLMDELTYGEVLPSRVSNTKMISGNIPFRPFSPPVAAMTDAATGEVTPAKPQMPRGGCVEFEIAQKKNSLKMNAKEEDGYFHYDPVLEVMMPKMDEYRDFQLELLNGCRVCVFFDDNNGRRRVGVNALCSVEPMLDDNSNGYKVMFKFGIMKEGFFYYSGIIPLKAA